MFSFAVRGNFQHLSAPHLSLLDNALMLLVKPARPPQPAQLQRCMQFPHYRRGANYWHRYEAGRKESPRLCVMHGGGCHRRGATKPFFFFFVRVGLRRARGGVHQPQYDLQGDKPG